MDNSQHVRAGSPEWFIMKRFAKTMIMIGTSETEGVTSLVEKYQIPRKQARSLFVSAKFDLCHLVS
ncbi:hypothetical protein VPHD518_0071 [Vibrio phage D518]